MSIVFAGAAPEEIGKHHIRMRAITSWPTSKATTDFDSSTILEMK